MPCCTQCLSVEVVYRFGLLSPFVRNMYVRSTSTPILQNTVITLATFSRRDNRTSETITMPHDWPREVEFDHVTLGIRNMTNLTTFCLQNSFSPR